MRADWFQRCASALPGLLKIKVVRKPATKARKMMSPFTGQEITVAAKPASRAVKVQPLSGLKRDRSRPH